MMSPAGDIPKDDRMAEPAKASHPEARSSRRQFVLKVTRRAAYVAPVVIGLAASRSAMAGSSPSGAPSGG